MSSIYEQVREIPSFCKVSKRGLVYLRYADSPIAEEKDRRGVVYVGQALGDGTMLTNYRFFDYCVKDPEVEEYQRKIKEKYEAEQKAAREERIRKKAEEKRIRWETTEYNVRPGFSILGERLFARTGVTEVLKTLLGDEDAAALRQMAAHHAYHSQRAFLDQTGMYGTYYPPEHFPYLYANGAAGVLSRLDANACETVYKTIFQNYKKKDLVAFPVKCELNVSGLGRNSDFLSFSENVFDMDTFLYERAIIYADRENGIPVYIEPIHGISSCEKIAKKMKALEDDGYTAIVASGAGATDLYWDIPELDEAGTKFAVNVPVSEPLAQQAIAQVHSSLLRSGNVTADAIRYQVMDAEVKGVRGRLMVGCRKLDRDWIISQRDERLAYAKHELMRSNQYEATDVELGYLFDVIYDGIQPVDIHLKKGGKKKFEYDAGYFVMFTNDLSVTGEEMAAWYYSQDNLDNMMNRTIHSSEGQDVTFSVTPESFELVFFLSAMLTSEIRRLLSPYMHSHDKAIYQVIDELTGVTITVKGGESYIDERNRKKLEEKKEVYEAAEITEKDLLAYAANISRNQKYFEEQDP